MAKVLVITGPTGSGKTTVSQYLTRKYQIPRVITHTTRPPRTGEVDQQDYYFETASSFAKKHYLEHVQYSFFEYGSSYEGLEAGWQKNNLISIVLDTAGAITYAQKLGEKAVIIFLEVTDNLVSRLQQRGDQQQRISKRMTSAEFLRDQALPAELRDVAHVIINDHWPDTEKQLDQLIKIVQAADESV